MLKPKLNPEIYTVAWIAPLEIEARAARCMLDELHVGSFASNQQNEYICAAGVMCGHNVVIATLPGRLAHCTTSAAAAMASHVKMIFPNLWFSLLVGLSTGLPDLSASPPRDIRLGDVLVALSEGDDPAVVAYDLGKETESEGFRLLRSGHVLAVTETIVRSAIGNIRLDWPKEDVCFLPHYMEMIRQNSTDRIFEDPGQKQDGFYQSTNYGDAMMVHRQRRSSVKRTQVWYGSIGSGDRVIKSACKRDELRDEYNLIGLENAAAGIMNRIPAGVICGVCDYGDKHNTEVWQPYAAAMAAAYAKEVLERIRPFEDTTTLPVPIRPFPWTAPCVRDTGFANREFILEQLAEIILSCAKLNIRQATPIDYSELFSGTNMRAENDSSDSHRLMRALVRDWLVGKGKPDEATILAPRGVTPTDSKPEYRIESKLLRCFANASKMPSLRSFTTDRMGDMRWLSKASIGSSFLGQPRSREELEPG